MAVIQDEQGNNKPIVTDTSHVFDVNGNPLHGELFIGETIASDDVEEADPFAHMSDVEGLIKQDSIQGTTDSNGYVTTSITTARKIIFAWIDGQPNNRVVTPVVNNSVYTMMVTNAQFVAAASQSVTIKYLYVS